MFTKHAGKLSWYYKPVDYPKSHIAEVYNIGETKLHPNSVVVYVWDWDDAWKVEWYEDGKYMGILDPTFDLSPNYIADINRAFKGKTIPGYKQPRLNWHYFAAAPSKDAKEVKMVVTSRFGQKWECVVDMTKYAGSQFKNEWPAEIPANAIQMLKEDGIF